ncbi:choline-phosphate cytidylyltransferase [Coniosporium tulheliwenetii]|uniref:Choline-phosphate cytidylyltransferase n=1 Tax=Coniosporium tulheliwenetii TaxID=3383036 RepID=A0ACC2Z4G0_9PEZI|nr:choline-phosphate cytidylyltransferase [Cladosporium sp. JES 115]
MPPKRKRTNTLTNTEPTINVAQPSSRDASEEDTMDPVLQEVLERKESEPSDPPSKRTRSHRRDSGSKAEDAKNETEDAIEHGENGERGTMSMEAPPKAGLVDPVGYHTNPPPTGRPVRIYCDGVFDLFHLGHMRQLQQAKTAFPDVYLIAGVTGDKETHRRKGLTVLSAKERAESVRHCRWVDEVIEDCPWIIADAPEFIEKHKIDYVAHDDIPYGAGEGDDIYAPIKKAGKFLVTQRTEGVSTTGIITKIVRDYDKYISRQLNRGTSRQELNVSWLKKNELELKRSMAELRDNIKNNWTTTGQELGKELRQFWQGSRQASPAGSIRGTSNSPKRDALSSPSVVARLGHLDVPKTGHGNGGLPQTSRLGTALGCWVVCALGRRNLNDSRPQSPDSSEDSSEDHKESTDVPRGRRGESIQDEVDAQVVEEMDTRR